MTRVIDSFGMRVLIDTEDKGRQPSECRVYRPSRRKLRKMIAQATKGAAQ